MNELHACMHLYSRRRNKKEKVVFRFISAATKATKVFAAAGDEAAASVSSLRASGVHATQLH